MSFFIIVLIALVNASPKSTEKACSKGTQHFYLKYSTKLDSLTVPGFQASIIEGLQAPLADIGYCPKSLKEWADWEPDTSLDAQKVLKIHPKVSVKQIDSIQKTEILLIAGLVNDKSVTPQKMDASFKRPLFSLPYKEEESEAISNILVQKIVENLRDRFTCHLMVQSTPSEINFQIDLGLSGVTPSEWVLPVGRDVFLEVKEKGFLPYQVRIPLRAPGEHHHFISLKKKRFYHSKMMIPTIFCTVMSGVSYYYHSIYYTQYKNLGKDDLGRDPSLFRKKFQQAKDWEYITLGCIAGAMGSFIFSFAF